VLLPILLLGSLNTLVPESGERVGYCITTLLAIHVYMTIIMDTLPQSSTPVPLISYKLVVDLVSSALIIVILNLRIHGQSDDKPVPAWLKTVYMCFTCRMCKRNSATVTPDNIESSLPGPVTSMDLNVLAIEEELKIPETGDATTAKFQS